MRHRRIGNSGLIVSAVGMGGDNFGGRADAQRSARVLDRAWETDINFVDTSNVYVMGLSEEIVGRWLQGKRDRVIVASKCGWPLGDGPYLRGASRKHIMEQADLSLRRLQTDYIDLYHIHTPDPETPIEETMRALDDLVRQGKVRYLGSSNFSAAQCVEAQRAARVHHRTPFVSEQPYYNLLRRGAEVELLPACRMLGLAVLPYFPLESGMLTGKYRREEAPGAGTRMAQVAEFRNRAFTERNFQIVRGLEQFALERGRSLAELAIAWLLANPIIPSVIAGATREEQVIENAGAADWELTAQDLRAIDAIAAPDGTSAPPPWRGTADPDAPVPAPFAGYAGPV